MQLLKLLFNWTEKPEISDSIPTCTGLPVGTKQAGESRYKVTAASVFHTASQCFCEQNKIASNFNKRLRQVYQHIDNFTVYNEYNYQLRKLSITDVIQSYKLTCFEI